MPRGLGDGIVAGMSCRVGAVEEGRREESSSRINSAIHRIDAGEMRTVLNCIVLYARLLLVLSIVCLVQIIRHIRHSHHITFQA